MEAGYKTYVKNKEEIGSWVDPTKTVRNKEFTKLNCVYKLPLVRELLKENFLSDSIHLT